MIGRRAIVGGLAGLAPALVRAQSARRLPVVAFLGFATAEGDRATLEAFRLGMREVGRIDGQTVTIEARHAGGDMARAAELIRELVALPVDVFLVPGQAAARALRRASSLPVVAIGLPPGQSDPELFASPARPGGTVTGFASFGEELSAKRIQILKETLPELKAIGILHNSTDPTSSAWGALTEADARAQGLTPIRLGLSSTSLPELRARLREARDRGAAAAVVVRDFLTATLIHDIAPAAAAEGIAAIGEQREFAEAGALFTYGADIPDLFRRAAGYVDRILNGARPGELPIQAPTKFEFVINLKTAKALGLTIPPSILARADEVIE